MTTTTTELTGEVIRAGDPGYEQARLGYNRLYQRYPQAIVFCRNTTDVVNAVRWAREAGIAFRARSGRHNLEGWSAVDGGLIIDVSRMKDIDVDEASGTATVTPAAVSASILRRSTLGRCLVSMSAGLRAMTCCSTARPRAAFRMRWKCRRVCGDRPPGLPSRRPSVAHRV